MNKTGNDSGSVLSYEAAVNRLEQVVHSLENEKISLEKVIELYEEGSKLVKLCNGILDQAELKIKILEQNFTETKVKDFTCLAFRDEVEK